MADDRSSDYDDVDGQSLGGARSRRIIISCENIQKTYLLGTEGVPALRGVGLDIYDGEFCVIYGNSGGGKTTLLNILGTIDTPTKGNLMMFNTRVHPRTPDSALAELRLHKLGFVFQTFNLLPTMTAAENVQVPMVLSGRMTKEEQQQRVEFLLKSVGMEERMRHYPSMLSGGEQQRVTIARAMANKPKVLLLDEPTGDLDTKNTKNVINILTRLNKEEGVTIIMVTHDPEMKWYANRAVYVQDGKIGRVDTINPADNRAAIAQLRKDLTALKHSRIGVESALGITSPPFSPGMSSANGVGNDDESPPLPSSPAPQFNEFREPENYATYSDKALCAPRALGDDLFSSIFGGSRTADGHSQGGSTAHVSQIALDMSSVGGHPLSSRGGAVPAGDQEMQSIGDGSPRV